MTVTNGELNALSNSQTFQGRVRAAIYKKALAIVEDYRANPGGNYTAQQNARALTICQSGHIAPYYGPMACSTNVIASVLSVANGETVSDISDAALDSQVYTVVFQDLV